MVTTSRPLSVIFCESTVRSSSVASRSLRGARVEILVQRRQWIGRQGRDQKRKKTYTQGEGRDGGGE